MYSETQPTRISSLYRTLIKTGFLLNILSKRVILSNIAEK